MRHLHRQTRRGRALPNPVLLILTVPLTSIVVYLTWPTRGAVFCEQLPELTALAACAAALLVLCFRTLAAALAQAQPGGSDARRLAGSAAVLAALALFLSARFVAQYHKPCAAIQQQLSPKRQGP